jgi:3-oxoacyl-[acyl-carrier-protein] synthase III
MVVSGEYITPLMETAQKEIQNALDPRLACLTLGDAGVAMILEQASTDTVGFHKMDMYTLGRYSTYCIAKATDQVHGGAIMLTDSLRLSAVAIQEASSHFASFHEQEEGSVDAMDYLIMHQTSRKTLSDGMGAVNKIFNKRVCHEGNVIINLTERGNTATTSHFVAIHDYILNNTIQRGDNITFSITASGLTVGTALYTFDDLPDRIRSRKNGGQYLALSRPAAVTTIAPPADTPRFRVESVGIVPDWRSTQSDTLEFTTIAAEDCLERSSHDRSDLDLLIYAGVYRSDFISEPAIATMVAGKLRVNDVIESPEQKKTLAFDVFNGAIGFLNACHLAIQMMRVARFECAMVVTSEVENNTHVPDKAPLGIKETGSAVILDKSNHENRGFGAFLFKYFTDYSDAYTVYATRDRENGRSFLECTRDASLEEYYLECIVDTVDTFLSRYQVSLSSIRKIFPPQISSAFISKLSERLHLQRGMFVELANYGEDYFTSSLPYTLWYAREQQLVDAKDIGLLICVGAGIQVGCALYYF